MLGCSWGTCRDEGKPQLFGFTLGAPSSSSWPGSGVGLGQEHPDQRPCREIGSSSRREGEARLCSHFLAIRSNRCCTASGMNGNQPRLSALECGAERVRAARPAAAAG